MHGKRILKLLQKIFSWLPLATVIDQKVLVLHGGISDTTDLSLLAKLDRHNVRNRQSLSLYQSHVNLHSQHIPETCALLISSPQYVSALRPPKKRHTTSTGTSIDSDMDEDVWSTNRIFQRRASLTYPKPLGERTSFHNRSLQDFSERLRPNALDAEQEASKRTQPVFNSSTAGRSEKDITLSVSSDSVNSENAKDEWKQVRNECRS